MKKSLKPIKSCVKGQQVHFNTKIGFLLITLLLTRLHSVSAQTYIFILDEVSKKPIEGVIVSGTGNNTGEVFNNITDSEGKVVIIGLSFPLTISTSHLVYETSTTSIKKAGLHSVQLKKASIQLDQFIVTGQHEPQSIDEAVYNVQVIDKQQIADQGAIDLTDVLNNQINITLTPDKQSGRTTISLLGLGAEYVKILLDGIPFVSTEGNGNNVDITQINLNTIERVEIVEGPMAVNYGSNAAAGVINLISKKTAEKSISIQEETVGPEYGLERGRHIQSINLGHYLTDQLLVRLDFRRNDFRGLQGEFEGRDHLLDDNRRGFDWRPKRQYSGGIYSAYNFKNTKLSYRYSYFQQRLDVFSPQVFLDLHVPTQTTNPFAFDQENKTKRFLHQLNVSSAFGRIKYHIVSAYTGVELFNQTFRRRLRTSVIQEVLDESNSYLNSFTSRGNFTNFLPHPNLSLEIGYEYTFEGLKQNFLSQEDEIQVTETVKTLDNYALFSSLEWELTDRWNIRPGIRYIYNSQYKAPLTYSINTKYKLAHNFDIRASVGRSYRTPNLTELFLYFVDANHDVTGNENLLPEDIFGTFIAIKKKIKLNGFDLNNSLTVYYNDVSNRISLAVINNEPLQFQYINIDEFKSKGLRFNHTLLFKKWTVNSGFSYNGRRRSITNVTQGADAFLFSSEFNFNATYHLVKDQLKLALFYKRTGRDEQFRVDDAAPEGFVKGRIEAFNQLDFTSTLQFSNRIQLTTGIRNIFNVTDVNSSVQSAGAHTPAPTTIGRSYGRSYFLRANYTFNR